MHARYLNLNLNCSVKGCFSVFELYLCVHVSIACLSFKGLIFLQMFPPISHILTIAFHFHSTTLIYKKFYYFKIILIFKVSH